MCIVIDTNCMASVFKPSTQDHSEFAPVLNWIFKGKGKLIIGGSDYLREISGFIGLITELSKVNKVVKIINEEVDTENENLKGLIDHKDYDDSHIIALLSISNCKLICSKDQRAYPFFKKRELYKSKSIPS